MNAEEARELTQHCIVHNDERNYDYAISKIIPMCSNGLNYVLAHDHEIYEVTINRLVSEGYEIEYLSSIDLIRISW